MIWREDGHASGNEWSIRRRVLLLVSWSIWGFGSRSIVSFRQNVLDNRCRFGSLVTWTLNWRMARRCRCCAQRGSKAAELALSCLHPLQQRVKE